MASPPNQSTAFLVGQRSRTKQFIKKPFKKISIKSSLLSAFTQKQPQPSSPTSTQPPSPPPSTYLAQPTSSPSHHYGDYSLPPWSPHSPPTSRRSSSSSSTTTTSQQLLWRLSGETSSSSTSSLQLAAYHSTTRQLSESSTIIHTSPPFLNHHHQQTPLSTEQSSYSPPHPHSHTSSLYYSNHHYNYNYKITMPTSKPTPGSNPSASPPPFEETPAFQKLPPVDRALAFIKHVVFVEHADLSAEYTEHITIKNDKTWTDLVKLGTFAEQVGTQQCQKLVKAPVIGEAICHKLWLRLAAIAREEEYTNEVTDYDKQRSNLLMEGKAEARERKKKEAEAEKMMMIKGGRKGEKEKEKEKGGGGKGVEGRLRKLKLGTSLSSSSGKGRKEGGKEGGEGDGGEEGEEDFWKEPEVYSPKTAPPELRARDTPVPDGLLAQLEGDADVMSALREKRRVTFADRATAAAKVKRERKIEDIKEEEEEEEEGKEEGKAAAVVTKDAAKDAENKNKRKAAEVKEGSGSSRPKIARSKSWKDKMSSIGGKVSYGLGPATGMSKDPKEDKGRKKSI
ncbi:hypothetical protein QBC41DRAFT_383431 [Cercophora samala]|uniref:Uncharacterized protein n=1 Tax=Cercophora samala TaxID=330535 RepID=A0AA39ZJY5_9PEZI|nr:hypothetical protein QBC41DRAFT_383431 [Cercophora samala]